MPGRRLLYNRFRYLIGYSAGKPWLAALGCGRFQHHALWLTGEHKQQFQQTEKL
jgi:hypothetical protein